MATGSGFHLGEGSPSVSPPTPGAVPWQLYRPSLCACWRGHCAALVPPVLGITGPPGSWPAPWGPKAVLLRDVPRLPPSPGAFRMVPQ